LTQILLQCATCWAHIREFTGTFHTVKQFCKCCDWVVCLPW
jgi:hypothetical protein